MNRLLRNNKSIVRNWMAANYSDARLTQLLDHARSGKLSFYSCCCFIGIVTANHELQTYEDYQCGQGAQGGHYLDALSLAGAFEAEQAYKWLYMKGAISRDDATRRRILIPMILAEIKRRQSLPQRKTIESEKVAHGIQ